MLPSASLGIAASRAGAAARGAYPAALALMFCSGAAGLVWQMVWTAWLGVALGHEMVAVLATVAAFFGGLAAGAALLAGPVERSARPARWYAALELVVAGWSLVVLFACEHALPLLSGAIGPQPSPLRHWGIAFVLPLVLLLPATVAMGATLPAMERVLRGAVARPLGALYACNTAGALAGLLLAVFVAIPGLGLRGTTLLFVLVNALCAHVAWLLWSEQVVGTAVAAQSRASAGTRLLVWLLFATGCLGIAYEVLALRVLSQVTENTVYTYAVLLAVFLLGTAAGAAWLRRGGRLAQASADTLLALLVLAMAAGAATLWWADVIVETVAGCLGGGPMAALAGEAAAGGAALLPPTLVMGAVFTHLCQRAQAAGLPLGTALGWNTAGAALAPLLVGLLLLPHLGARGTLVLLLTAYLALRSPAGWRAPPGWAALALVAAFALLAPPLRFVDVPQGGRIASYRDGVMAAVSVVEDAEGVARLHINNRVQEGSSASGQVEIRLAQLPLLLHPAPRRVLFLGLGTGYTARAAALDPGLQVDAVELVPEVVAAADLFARKPGAPAAARPVHVVSADARRFVQAAPERYDVIVSDLFHPARSGAGSLYTVEHFAAVRERLQPGGVFCQWLALHQMDLATLRSIVAAFTQVHPGAVAVLASNSLDTPVIGLIATRGDARWRLEEIARHLETRPAAVQRALQQARLDGPFAVLGSIIAGPEALRRFAAGTAPNTDDRPLVSYRAPWTTYAPEAAPRARLAALVDALQPEPADVLGADATPDAPRLAAYWRARADYLRIGLQTRPHPDARVMLQRLRGPLLHVLATSPDFGPAAEALAALGQAARRPDPSSAD